MAVILPKLLVLDSATLGKASHDYWSPHQPARVKAREFVERLVEYSLYIALTTTHVSELLRHNDRSLVRDRLRFLRALPLIAWLRPYNRHWFPGGLPDLLRRELHAVVHAGKRDWRAIIEHVRADLWETGVGAEMFPDDDSFWLALRRLFKRQQLNEQLVASIGRTDPGNMGDLTIAETERLPLRPKGEWDAFLPAFATMLKSQLQNHGDQRLKSPREDALAFLTGVFRDLRRFDAAGGSLFDRLLEQHGVPKELVRPDMTVADLGQLAVYVQQLKLISGDLHPPASITVHDVPPNALPSYALERKLMAIQRRADRVSGSDVGDGHIAVLTLYADGVEVDKRTHEFLTQIQRSDDNLKRLMQPFVRSPDYKDIPARFAPAA